MLLWRLLVVLAVPPAIAEGPPSALLDQSERVSVNGGKLRGRDEAGDQQEPVGAERGDHLWGAGASGCCSRQRACRPARCVAYFPALGGSASADVGAYALEAAHRAPGAPLWPLKPAGLGAGGRGCARVCRN
jgi:hypothetical protein